MGINLRLLTRAQGYHAHGWLRDHVNGVHGLQDPANRSIASATNHFKIRYIFEEGQPLDRSSLGQVVDLARIQHVLEFPEYSVALPAAALRIDKHEQRTRSARRRNLEMHRCGHSLQLGKLAMCSSSCYRRPSPQIKSACR